MLGTRQRISAIRNEDDDTDDLKGKKGEDPRPEPCEQILSFLSVGARFQTLPPGLEPPRPGARHTMARQALREDKVRAARSKEDQKTGGA
jgi:hypothetical protein